MTATSGFAARLKRGAAFVAIVWGVAASYVGFEIVAMRAMDFALGYPEVFGRLALPRTVTGATTCRAAPADGAEREPRAGRAASFALGVAVGREAVFRQWASSTPELVEPLSAHVQEAASALGVPPPGSFVPQRVADANREFVLWIEADRLETARQLAARYSPQACHAYKLGAVWGYSEVVRMALPAERLVFPVEIQYYAREIPIPDDLWRPMLPPAASPAGSAELEAEMAAISARIVAYLDDRR